MKVQDSQFFRRTTALHSGLDAFDESWWMPLKFCYDLFILGVMEILCSVKLVLEGKRGREITMSSKLGFLETLWANKFALWDAHWQYPWSVE